MAEHANQSLPGAAFFFAKRTADVRQYDERMGNAFLPERTAAE